MVNRGTRQVEISPIVCSTHSILQLLAEIETLLRDKRASPRSLLCLNAHIYNIAYRDRHLRESLHHARVVTADGMSIVWASRLLGSTILERCNMTEAFRAFLEAKNMPHSRAILIGCSDREACAAGRRVQTLSVHCRVLQTFSGYMDDGAYRRILASFPDIDVVLIGMGSPRSEQVAEIAEAACPEAIIWHIGAGTIRVLAGTLREAPIVLRRIGLQWLYRLAEEPCALWRRYLIGNPLFVYRIFRLMIRHSRVIPSQMDP